MYFYMKWERVLYATYCEHNRFFCRNDTDWDRSGKKEVQNTDITDSSDSYAGSGDDAPWRCDGSGK